MSGSSLGAFRVNGPHEFCVIAKFLEHTCVFPTHRAIHHGPRSSLRNFPGGADRHRAINDREGRLEKLYVASALPHKVSYLKREADVQHINLPNLRRNGRNVHSDGFVALREKLKQRLADLSESDHKDAIFLLHRSVSLRKLRTRDIRLRQPTH